MQSISVSVYSADCTHSMMKFFVSVDCVMMQQLTNQRSSSTFETSLETFGKVHVN